MQPLTPEEVAKANELIAALGSDQLQKKTEIISMFNGGGEAWLVYIRNFINQQ